MVVYNREGKVFGDFDDKDFKNLHHADFFATWYEEESLNPSSYFYHYKVERFNVPHIEKNMFGFDVPDNTEVTIIAPKERNKQIQDIQSNSKERMNTKQRKSKKKEISNEQLSL